MKLLRVSYNRYLTILGDLIEGKQGQNILGVRYVAANSTHFYDLTQVKDHTAVVLADALSKLVKDTPR